MILTTLATAALAIYTTRSALALCRDQDIRDALERLRARAAGTFETARNDIADAAAKTRQRKQARQDYLLISRLFDCATDDERQTLAEILARYTKDLA